MACQEGKGKFPMASPNQTHSCLGWKITTNMWAGCHYELKAKGKDNKLSPKEF
jgi:hypothetical protein